MEENKKIRLNRYLSGAGATSRRKADEYIAEGRVTVNGRVVADLGSKIDPERDRIFLDGKQVVVLDRRVYLLFNKPRDCITTLSDERGRSTVLHYVRVPQRVFPVGRLDRNTTGVLLLTNDGDFANALMHPRNQLVKTYIVTADRPVTEAAIRKLASGVRLSDGMTRPAGAGPVPGGGNRVVGISIHEGRNRQLHRMFEALGYTVEKLERVSYGSVTTEGLPRGKWRHLTAREVASLRSMCGPGESPGTLPPGKTAGADRRSRKHPGIARRAGKPAGNKRRGRAKTGPGRRKGV